MRKQTGTHPADVLLSLSPSRVYSQRIWRSNILAPLIRVFATPLLPGIQPLILCGETTTLSSLALESGTTFWLWFAPALAWGFCRLSRHHHSSKFLDAKRAGSIYRWKERKVRENKCGQTHLVSSSSPAFPLEWQQKGPTESNTLKTMQEIWMERNSERTGKERRRWKRKRKISFEPTFSTKEYKNWGGETDSLPILYAPACTSPFSCDPRKPLRHEINIILGWH